MRSLFSEVAARNMDVLETATELYDLFGETGTCVICQEDLQDGERVRSLKDCSHIFHAQCVDEWLSRKMECPMCRKTVGPAPPAPSAPADAAERLRQITQNLREMYTTLQGLMNGNTTPNTIPNFQTLFTTLRAVLEAAPVPNTREGALAGVNSVELRIRYALSFVLLDGILRRFPNATVYSPRRAQIQTTLANFQAQGLRPLPIDTETYAALVRSHERMRDECKTRFQITGNIRTLRGCPHIKNWVTALSSRPELQDLWVAVTPADL